MSEPFLGELRLVGFNFAPRGWALCNGQVLTISSNTALFSLLGTTYGGDGRTTFALPDLRGRAPLHAGNGPGLTPRQLGEQGGVESVTLTAQQIPDDIHPGADQVTNRASSATGLAHGGLYASAAAMTLGTVGAAQPHPNMPPFLTMNWVIALQGIFPSRP